MLSGSFCFSQDEAIDKSIEWIMDNQPEAGLTNEIDIAQMQSDLEFLLKNPININTKSTQDLVHYGLITQIQYNSLQEHIDKYGALKAIEELQIIEGFGTDQILILSHFISTNNFAGSISLHREIKETKNDLTLHYNQLIQEKAGFSDDEQFYLGHPSRLMLKFKTQFYSKWKLAINLEKDAGEKLAWDWKNNRRAFDHSSLYLEYKSNAILQKLIIGDYQLRLGQALTFWKGFAFKKSSNTIGIRKVANELKAHTGMDEVNFLRGLSFILKHKKTQFIPFVSFRKIDAIILDTDQGVINSIQSSGLHRSLRELSYKARLNELVFGTYLSFSLSKIKLGSSFVYQHYNFPFNEESTLQRPFPFSGSENYLIGIDADYTFKNGHVFTEISRSANASISYLIGIVLSPDKRLSFSLYHRKFAKDFHAISSNALGEGALNKNEEGIYLGLEYSPKYKMLVSAYYDLYRFPWISNKTDGSDFVLSAVIPINKRSKSLIKYRRELINDSHHQQSIRHKIRIQNEHILSSKFQLRYRLSYHHFSSITKNNGYLFFVDLIFQHPESPFSLSSRYAIFNTDDYNTRIYAYERDAYFTYSVRPYYYKGQKIYLNLKWRLRRFFTFFIRFSHITFPYLDEIGSSNELISTNNKSEFTVQLRVRW